MGDLISRKEAIDAVCKSECESGFCGIPCPEVDALKSLPSPQPMVLTCDGCRYVGTYDTDFPCSGCIRREKDYYDQER